MSHLMTALAMKQPGLKPAAKIVLYWLADHHNGETGQCNPSINRLAKCCEMSRRSVEAHLQALQDAGLITIQNRTREVGGKTSNSYTLCMVESDAQNLRMGYAKSAHGGCAKSAHDRTLEDTNLVTEYIGAAPRPSKGEDVKSILCQWVSTEAASSFIAYRRKNKGKALTVTAAKRLAKHLEAIFQSGADPDDALGLAEERGWQSVQADWYFNAKEQRDGNRGNGRGSTPDTASQQIAFAGSFRRTPSEDCF